MSDAQHEPQSLIRTPKQLVVAVAGFFLVIVLGIILLVTFVTSSSTTGAGTDGQSPQAIFSRIRPVSEQGFTLVDASAPRILQAGSVVYMANCAACHDSGTAGSPKVGDNEAWRARLAQDYDTLVKHAIEGIRAMPAKGGNPDLDDLEVERAVVFIANKSGASYKEPAIPAQAPAPVEPIAVTAPTIPTPAASALPLVSAAIASTDLGKKAYDSACIACHGAGIAGAPKFGDKSAWTARLEQGNAVLYEHAIKGFQGKASLMPPKGGANIADAEVKAAVDFMVAAVK